MRTEKVIKLKGIDLTNCKFDDQGFIQEGGVIKDIRLCFRPGHKSHMYQTWAEKYKGKFISHNYGHAGIGYCMSFGSAKRAVDNLENLVRKDVKNEEITILGAGVIGLTTAIDLHLRGYKNIGIVTESFGENNASFGAGALIDLCFNEVPEDKKYHNILISDFGESYKQYKNITEGKHELIKEGVKLIDYYTDSEKWPEFQNQISGEPVQVNIKVEAHDRIFKMFLLKTFHVVPPVYMNHLYKIITEQLKIPLIFKKIVSLDDINSEYIFNCTGLGSKILARDNDVIPICGHTIAFNYPKQVEELNYVINMNSCHLLGVKNLSGFVYFMPKISGLVGGTYILDYDGNNKVFNKNLTTKLVQNARYLFNGIEPDKHIDIQMFPKF
jgi:hypothetical protein